MNDKQNSFGSFYKNAAKLWLIILLLCGLILYIIVPQIEDLETRDSLSKFVTTSGVFGLFGIPLIMLFSIPIRLAEKILNKIEKRIKKE